MSYSGRLRVVVCDARMKAIDVGKAQRVLEKAEVYPDSSFLEAMEMAADGAIDEGLTDAMIEIPKDRCWFSGNYASDDNLTLIASMIVGKLSGYFVGEDGGIYGGFEIVDGRLEKRTVTVTLTRPDEAAGRPA